MTPATQYSLRRSTRTPVLNPSTICLQAFADEIAAESRRSQSKFIWSPMRKFLETKDLAWPDKPNKPSQQVLSTVSYCARAPSLSVG